MTEQTRILLVDDEPLLTESLGIILLFYKYTVVGKALDGNEALGILQQTECDLALVDLNMKGMGGIELIGNIKRRVSVLSVSLGLFLVLTYIMSILLSCCEVSMKALVVGHLSKTQVIFPVPVVFGIDETLPQEKAQARYTEQTRLRKKSKRMRA